MSKSDLLFTEQLDTLADEIVELQEKIEIRERVYNAIKEYLYNKKEE